MCWWVYLEKQENNVGKKKKFSQYISLSKDDWIKLITNKKKWIDLV